LEILYGSALTLRLTPLAIVLLCIAPGGADAAATHCYRLLPRRAWTANFCWRLRSAGAAPWLIFAVVFLLVFQEFELATAWGIRSWTVALFDAQSGGLALPESMRLAAVPLGIEAALLGGICALSRNLRRARPLESAPTLRGRVGLWTFVGLAFGAWVALPLVTIVRQAAPAIPNVAEHLPFLREIVNSVAAAIVTALACRWIAARFAKCRSSWLLVLPGLLGSLLIGLLLLGLFQFPALHLLGSTPLPFLLGLTLLWLPLTLAGQRALSTSTDPAALHVARLADARPVLGRLHTLPALWLGLVVFCGAYGDFTISSLLAPPGVGLVFGRLFSLMHYGRSAALSLLVLAATAAPLLVLWLTHSTVASYARRRVR
jgi:hypothetical protein